MADLESAADAALVKVKEFGADVDRAHTALADLEQRVAALAGQVDSDWSALEERLRSFLESARAEREKLAAAGPEAAEALGELERTSAQAGAEGAPEVESARAALSALGEGVRSAQPVLADLVEAMEGSARSLSDRTDAIEQQLQQALTEARDFLGVEVLTDLQAMQTEIQERSESLYTAITVDCETALTDKAADWEAKLAEVVELVEQQGFEDSRQHVVDVVDFSLKECGDRHREAFDELEGLVRTLDDGLKSLDQAIDQRRGDLDSQAGDLEREMVETHTRLEAMVSALDRVSERLKLFTFVEI